jgi:uncharacterized protein YdeI (YjbR/CyaY-like superfamily)
MAETHAKDNLPVVYFETPADWEAWLAAHHATAKGLWVKFAKKESGVPSMTYAQAVDGALCYGWIDGQSAAFDDKFWLQRFTPRRAKSKWSKINCDKVTVLLAEGRMQPAGLAEVEAAKADGRWERAYEPPSTISVPEDFQQRLDENPQAQAAFMTLNSTNRYAILYRIQDAKKPETRARRIEKFITMLNEGKTLY